MGVPVMNMTARGAVLALYRRQLAERRRDRVRLTPGGAAAALRRAREVPLPVYWHTTAPVLITPPARGPVRAAEPTPREMRDAVRLHLPYAAWVPDARRTFGAVHHVDRITRAGHTTACALVIRDGWRRANGADITCWGCSTVMRVAL
jgi:hypothetical protein